jgi:uncharacterized protein YndB with AHSA1/START domain
MRGETFVYTTYIRTTPERLFQALTDPAFTRAYWCETWQDCAWTTGATWRMMTPDGRIADSGEVLLYDPPRRFTVSWRHELHAEMTKEGHSEVAFVLEPMGTEVKLTVTHRSGVDGSTLIAAISQGWPPILSSLKSYLETGEALALTRTWPKGM